ncbi:DUF2061 domain-containing protein [Roseovarius sp. PS-C2]|uniref:DUF2061 domain-containing protein n=1 Tax=Roseovarius sp. PS-C2 TaxID=2820814 RepID=UPI001C0D0516|nr:DUF2061 domain-containing protein [Roseovarius sp. PS-C2]MBU3258842.1 DUF2061 domain-containing protein [Roseovarius sp. PS-C2]
METRKRTLVKAIVWNIIGLTVMALVGLTLTGSVAVGGAMAVVNTMIGLTMYVLYERVWARISWGRHHV